MAKPTKTTAAPVKAVATPSLRIKPLGDRVLVKALDVSEVVKGGIIIPDSAKEKPTEATVVALGTGAKDKDGNLVAFSVKAGDTVIIAKYGGTEIKHDGTTYTLLREEDILAIVG